MRPLGWITAVAGALVVALLSGVPVGEPQVDGLLRLSWRARGEQVRVCRERSDAELERLPVHMRQRELCERRLVPYRLQVDLDSARAIDAVIHAGGAHQDRPLFVFFEHPLQPGVHRLRVSFEHILGAEPFREAEEHPAHEARETPPLLTLDDTITVARGSVVVVTYDDERKALRLLAAP